MSLRLNLLNFALRHIGKWALGRVQDPVLSRKLVLYPSKYFLWMPRQARQSEAVLTHAGRSVPVTKVHCGAPEDAPVLLYLHGGAYIMGAPATHAHLAARLALLAGIRAVLPDYRLAPENPFPAATDDVMTCYKALLAEGVKAKRIAVCGDSAGGGLTLALLYQIGEESLPMPGCSVTFSAITDFRFSGDSFTENAATEVILPADRVKDVCDMYLGETSPDDPRASPLRGNFTKASPVLLHASKVELLRDDTVRIAKVMQDQGCDATYKLWEATPHAWHTFQGYLPEANEAVKEAAAFIQHHLTASKSGDS